MGRKATPPPVGSVLALGYMSFLWHWTSDVWLWVFLHLDISIKLNLSPIVVQEAAEGAIWVSILWHWASDIWLWVLF